VKRRTFITVLGGAAAWPLAARAQQPERMRRIGVLSPYPANDTEGHARLTAFAQALQQLGWTVGQNVRIDYRWGPGNAETMRKYATELVALAPDVVLANTTAAIAPLLEASRTVPIVFAAVADPVAAGFVESLARPGGNATGFTVYEYSISGKWLEPLKEVAPRVMRAAVLRELGIAPGLAQFGAIQALAPSLGVELRPVGVRDADEIERGLAAFVRRRHHRDRQPPGGYAARPDHRAGGQASLARGVQRPLLPRCRRSDLLWARFPRPASARGRLRRPHP
jgi:putative ABC transport system substrate-binding protein